MGVVERRRRLKQAIGMATVQINVPKELLELAAAGEIDLSASAVRIIALELFRERRISLERAARLSGVCLEDFMKFSAERQVPMHYTVEDWRQDQETAAELKL
jgi:predicted HTH domain antitoxin